MLISNPVIYNVLIFTKKSPIDIFWLKEWDNFIKLRKNGNIFQTPSMFTSYLNYKNYDPYAMICTGDDDNVQGVLLAVIQKEYKGLLGFLSSRCLIIGGPVILDNDLNVLEALLSQYVKSVAKKPVLTQFRNFEIQGSGQKDIFRKFQFRFEDHLNILLDLRIGKDSLWHNLSRSRKKGIKKAQKENFVFEPTKDISLLPEFHKMLSASYKKIGLPFPGIDHFTNLFKYLDHDEISLFTLRGDDVTIAVLFALIYNNTFYGYYLGISNAAYHSKLKPIDFFFWEVIKWATENGLSFYDWMGAGKPDKKYGVRDFKLQFGGETQNFGRYERINYPLVYIISRVGLFIMGKIKAIL